MEMDATGTMTILIPVATMARELGTRAVSVTAVELEPRASMVIVWTRQLEILTEMDVITTKTTQQTAGAEPGTMMTLWRPQTVARVFN